MTTQRPEKRPPPLSLRLSDEQRRNLEMRAGDIPVSTYVKNVLFEGEDFAKASADRILAARLLGMLGLSDIATNLATLAEQASAGTVWDDKTLVQVTQARDHLHAIRTLLLKALGKEILDAIPQTLPSPSIDPSLVNQGADAHG